MSIGPGGPAHRSVCGHVVMRNYNNKAKESRQAVENTLWRQNRNWRLSVSGERLRETHRMLVLLVYVLLLFVVVVVL